VLAFPLTIRFAATNDGRPTAILPLCYKILLEPITHFLTGAVLARAGFNRKTALATATMTLAAEAPDLDVFWGFKGPIYGFAHHRGFTHSFLGLFLVSAVITGLMYLIWRLRGRRTNIPDLPPRWDLLFLFAYIAGLSHILLDFTNNYGVRPFWPFSEKWYSWGVAFIVEPPILILLLAALVIPAFFRRRVSRQGLRGSLAARVGLACIVMLWMTRAYEASEIKGKLRTQQFDTEAPVRVSAYPYWPIPSRSNWKTELRWAGIAETKTFLSLADVKPFSKTTHYDWTIFPKFPDTPATLAAKRSYLGRVYIDWAQYPLLIETTDGQDTVVYFSDLRFGDPVRLGRSVLGASVVLNKNLRIVSEAMGTRQQSPPID
jgi:inner membrane protein